MNEKLKQAVRRWGNNPSHSADWIVDTRYGRDAFAVHSSDAELPAHAYAVLAAALRGEIPGFQLVPVEPTEKMIGAWAELALGRIKNPEANKGLMASIEENYAAVLTASREQQK